MSSAPRPSAIKFTSSRTEYTCHPVFPEKAVERLQEVPNVFTEIVNDIPNRMTALRAIEPDKGREWAMILHPNGRAYWYHEADSQRTVLDMEIIDGPQFLAAIEARRMLWQLARPAALDPPSKEIREPSELTLRRGKQQHTLEYYFTDWTRRSLGWVHVTESSRGVGCLVNEVGTTLGIPGNPSGKWVLLRDAGCPEKDGALVATICELEFWKHVARFPVHRALPGNAQDELLCFLNFKPIDLHSFAGSTPLWNDDECHALAKIVETETSELRADLWRHTASEAAARELRLASFRSACVRNAAVARITCQILAHRVRQIYSKSKGSAVGLKPDMRALERRSSRDRIQPLTWLLPGLQFGQAARIRRKLAHVLYDETLYLDQWVMFLRDSVAQELNTVAANGSVLLAANLAFLALTGISEAKQGLPLVCKYLVISSTFMSTGAICLAALVLGLYRRIKEMHSHELARFIKERRLLGLHSLPVLFSMPSSTIIWAMLDFLAAVLGSGLQDWSHMIAIPFLVITLATLFVHLLWVFSFRAALRSSLRAHVLVEQGGRGEDRLKWVFSLPEPEKKGPGNEEEHHDMALWIRRIWGGLRARRGAPAGAPAAEPSSVDAARTV